MAEEESIGKLRRIELDNLKARFRNSMPFVLLDPAAGDGTDAERLVMACSDKANQVVKVGARWRRSIANPQYEKNNIEITEDFSKVILPAAKFGAVYLHLEGRRSLHLLEYLERTEQLLVEEGVLIVLTDMECLKRGSGKQNAAEFICERFNKISVNLTASHQLLIMGVKGKRDTTPAKLYSLCGIATAIMPLRGKIVYDIPYTAHIKTSSVMIDTGITKKAASQAMDGYSADLERLELLLPPVFEARRPIMPLRKGHIAQLLASGLVNGGIVHPKTKERFIIKGSSVRVETKEELEDGEGEKTYSREVVSIKMMDQNGVIADIS